MTLGENIMDSVISRNKFVGESTTSSSLQGNILGISRPAERYNLQHVLGLPQGLLPVGHGWDISPRRHPCQMSKLPQ